jgi:hypothetical protein
LRARSFGERFNRRNLTRRENYILTFDFQTSMSKPLNVQLLDAWRVGGALS